MVETVDLQENSYFLKGIKNKLVTSLKLWLMGNSVFRQEIIELFLNY